MTRAERVAELGAKPSLSDAELGELRTLLGTHCNTGSPELVHQLYDPPGMGGWGYPPRYIKEGNRNTTRLARDTGALLSLHRHFPDDPPIATILKMSDLLTQLKTLGCAIDSDGRIRYSANLGGTETQRHTCQAQKKAPDSRTGYNLHTVTEVHKHLFLADEGCELWNLDLKGADGWTIACECAALGDRRMLDDLLADIKPAQAVALLFTHGEVVNSWAPADVKAKAAEIDKNGWLYMAAKKGIWSFCYGAGEQSMISTIADESYKETGAPVWVEISAMRNLRRCILSRYPGIAKRQRRIEMLLDRDGFLECANGSRRVFFGNSWDAKVRGEAYAHHPQVMTTYVTSLAWKNLWYDPDNANADGSRKAMPLLLVHDSILMQSPLALHDWVKARLPVWFDNPVTIAGTTVKVPFSGGSGPTWVHACNLPGYPATDRL